MIALAIIVAGLAVALAVWDVFRRALASQVELTRLRVEGLRREELAALATRLDDAEREIASLTSAVAFGRKR